MKKNLLWVMAAILTCSLMTACSSSDDNDSKETNIEVLYSANVSDDVLKVADLSVIYLDQAGNKQQEALTSKEWKKSISSKTVPMTVGICVKATPKSSIAEGEYKLEVVTSSAIAGIMSSGKEIGKLVGSNSSATRTADKVPEFCSGLSGAAAKIDADGNVTDFDYKF